MLDFLDLGPVDWIFGIGISLERIKRTGMEKRDYSGALRKTETE